MPKISAALRARLPKASFAVPVSVHMRCHRIARCHLARYVANSCMQCGPVDELLNVGVERPALDQLEVEVGRALKDRV